MINLPPSDTNVNIAGVMPRVTFILTLVFGLYITSSLYFLLVPYPIIKVVDEKVLGVSDTAHSIKMSNSTEYRVFCKSDLLFGSEINDKNIKLGCRNIPFKYTFPTLFGSWDKKLKNKESVLISCPKGELTYERKSNVSGMLMCKGASVGNKVVLDVVQSSSSNNPKIVSVPETKHAGFNDPILISSQNYINLSKSNQLEGRGPFIINVLLMGTSLDEIYKAEIKKILEINDPSVPKWLNFSSYTSMKSVLLQKGPGEYPTNLDYLKSLGVDTLSYNSDLLTTPTEEVNDVVGYVSDFAKFASENNIDVAWQPAGVVLEKISAEDLEILITAGLDWLGIQEQNNLATQCTDDRVRELKVISSSVKKYNNLRLLVQLLPTSCLKGDKLPQSLCPSENANSYLYEHCDRYVNSGNTELNALYVHAYTPTDMSSLPMFIDELRNALPTN